MHAKPKLILYNYNNSFICIWKGTLFLSNVDTLYCDSMYVVVCKRRFSSILPLHLYETRSGRLKFN